MQLKSGQALYSSHSHSEDTKWEAEQFPQILLLPGVHDDLRCWHQYSQCEHQCAVFDWDSLSILGAAWSFVLNCMWFEWHHYKIPRHLCLLPSITVSFLSEINSKMLYYGEEQELSSEEISEKLVLAQKMLEEIRRRQPFFTQRELVDEEADEAHERRCIQLLAPSTRLLSLWVQEKTSSHRETFTQGNQFPIFRPILELRRDLRESFRTTWLTGRRFLDPSPTVSPWETTEIPQGIYRILTPEKKK